MKLKLQKLTIENFKGIRNFALETNGESILIAGKNGVGKTTLADAWFFLFTDADSQGSAKFNALELDQSGAVIDQQDATVEAEIEIDGQAHRLKKTYRQKWKKTRGASHAEKVGHTTEHFWDDVPVSKKKYIAKIEGILRPELFRALSDVHEFCGRMKPEQRRQILIDVAGSVSDTEICAHPDLEGFLELLGDKTPEELKKVLMIDRKKCNEQLEQLPGRIDELEKSKPDVSGADEAEIHGGIADLDEQISAKKNEILAIRSGLAVSELRAELADLKAQASALDDDRRELHRAEISKLQSDMDTLSRAMAECRKRKAELQDRKDEFIKEWQKIDSKKYIKSSTCYACGQALPDAEIEKNRESFECTKQAEIDALNKKGRGINQRLSVYDADIERFKKNYESHQKAIEAHRAALDAIDDELTEKRSPLAARQAEIEAKIKNMQGDIEAEIVPLENGLSKLDIERGRLADRLSDFTQIERINQRIKHRKDELKQAAAQWERIAHHLDQIEIYSRRRSEYIEKNVNRHFKITTWKLFEEQVNGGIRETCEALRNGVPYSSDLNTGSKINVGLDVIRTLQAHYDCRLPVWVDNAESVTAWEDFGGQVIKLAAAPNINELEVIAG